MKPAVITSVSATTVRTKWALPVAIACLIAALGAVAWEEITPLHTSQLANDGPDAITTVNGNTMGGTWSVKIVRMPASDSSDLIQQSVGSLLDRLDCEMSIWKPESDLSRFNRDRTCAWIDVPADLAHVVDQAQRVSAQTHGAFDITVGPLVLLWGFGPVKSGAQINQIPSPQRIAEARSHVDYHQLECRLSPPALRKRDPLLYVDLGAIAKGYAAEVVARQLEAMGIHNYLVAVGGELHAGGFSQFNHPWSVGIETPTADVRRVFRQLPLRDASLSTSGDYRNFFMVQGKRYCHEINPRTGWPIDSNLASVSVIHPSGTYADAMATALMVLGPGDGLALANQLQIPTLFILRGDGAFQTRETAGSNLFIRASVSSPPVN